MIGPLLDDADGVKLDFYARDWSTFFLSLKGLFGRIIEAFPSALVARYTDCLSRALATSEAQTIEYAAPIGH